MSVARNQGPQKQDGVVDNAKILASASSEMSPCRYNLVGPNTVIPNTARLFNVDVGARTKKIVLQCPKMCGLSSFDENCQNEMQITHVNS